MATALGSALLGLKFFEELPARDAAGQPIIGARTPLDLDACEGAARLVAMAAAALAECSDDPPGSVPAAPAPLLLCLPEPNQRFAPRDVLADVCDQVGPAIDGAQSRVILGGRCALFTALDQAGRLLFAGAARDVYVGAVDSLIDREPLDALLRAGRIRTGTSEGFVPGEGAGFLRLRLRADRDTRALLVGTGQAEEPASRDGDQADELPNAEPNLGAALALAAQAALRAAALHASAASAIVHSASGDRRDFREAGFAVTRLRPRADPPISVWTPASAAGELGAGYGPFALALAAHFLQQEVTPGPAVLILAADDGPNRCAAVVAPAPGYAPSRR